MAGLSVGQKIPYFELPDQVDYPWSLSGQLETAPVVLVFYRGDWEPYCNGQLASYARNYREFERRGVQVAGISVDPPRNNARMVGKLRLAFPLLSDPEGEISRRYGLWDAEEGVATPAVVVVDQSGEVRYLYTGSDPADRPEDEEVFAAIRGLARGIERITGGPEFRVTAAQARETSARPDRPTMELEHLLPCYHGILSATTVVKRRFGGWGRRRATREVDRYEAMVRRYAEALRETVEIQNQEG